MNNTNEKIKDYLIEYCKLVNPPEYAVLIKGKWGSGKTWFIKDVIEQLNKENVKSMHVSLYGMTNFSDIEAEFFRKLHPFLSSSKMMLFGKFAKGLIKTAINVDLNNDGRSDGSLTSAIPDIDLANYLNNTENLVLVFDDIERCSIRINDLLGYINHFVEHGGYKVILIANEEEMLSSGSDQNELQKYQRIKEKLIGKTFEIEPEIDDALAKFLEEYPDHRRNGTIKKSKELIRDLYIQSKYKNLRHLKQAISDFARLIGKLSINAQNNEELVGKLLINFFVLSFEIKSGNILPSEIAGIKKSTLSRLLKKTTDSVSEKYSEISNKYPLFYSYDLVLNENEWTEILDKGIFDEGAIMNTLNSSIYLMNSESPNWKRLWYSLELDDTEVAELLNKVEKELDGKEVLIPQVLLHIVGIFLGLKNIGVLSKSKKTIVSDAKKYINFLKYNGNLHGSRKIYGQFPHTESFDGLGYTERDSIEFKNVVEYLKDQTQKAINDNYPNEAQKLLDILMTHTDEFCLKIHLSNSSANLYFETPILKYISPEGFVSAFSQLPQRLKWSVQRAVEERYQHEEFSLKLLEEAHWLGRVAKALANEAKHSSTIRKFNLLKASKIFKDLFAKLEELKTNKTSIASNQ